MWFVAVFDYEAPVPRDIKMKGRILEFLRLLSHWKICNFCAATTDKNYFVCFVNKYCEIGNNSILHGFYFKKMLFQLGSKLANRLLLQL